MNMLNISCIVIGATAVLAALIIVYINRRQTKNTVGKLNKMLMSAIDGSFSETTYDESTLSALESRMYRYLLECAASSKNLTFEKDKIKTLITDISHQTKTPIANILLYSQLLSEYELTEDCKICVKALSTQAEKLNFLIGALVKTSRLEAGIITVNPQKEHVQTLLDSVVGQILPKADAKNISISYQNTSDVACFDMKWTTEAIYNMLDNAVKYSPVKSMITIKTMPYELFYRLDITDEGIGIAEEEQSKIFTRFYRSKAVENEEGVGIGLFLAREIISAEDGYIKVSSILGKGSTFSLFLPYII